MFSKTIVQSSKFLRMPDTSRLLYYDLGMACDDDGFCEWFPVLQMTGAKEQDLQVIQANGFAKILDNEVVLVTDWKENNQIRLDRYQPSKHLVTYKDIIGVPNGNQRLTEVRSGEERREKTGKELSRTVDKSVDNFRKHAFKLPR